MGGADAARRAPRVDGGRAGLPESMRDAETLMILSALRRHDANVTRAAEQLGISRRTLQRKFLEDPDLARQAKAVREEVRAAKRRKPATAAGSA